jgi:hypothetical protein
MAEKKCFVISPFGAPGSGVAREVDWVLEGMIKPALAGDFAISWMDRSPESADLVTSGVVSSIQKADLIVAILTGHNPNVFYQLALAHSFMKPVVSLIKEGEHLPFDAQSAATIVYRHDDIAQWSRAQHELQNATQQALKPDFKVSNPVTMALGARSLSLLAFDRPAPMDEGPIKVEPASIIKIPPAGVVPSFGSVERVEREEILQRLERLERALPARIGHNRPPLGEELNEETAPNAVREAAAIVRDELKQPEPNVRDVARAGSFLEKAGRWIADKLEAAAKGYGEAIGAAAAAGTLAIAAPYFPALKEALIDVVHHISVWLHAVVPSL